MNKSVDALIVHVVRLLDLRHRVLYCLKNTAGRRLLKIQYACGREIMKKKI